MGLNCVCLLLWGVLGLTTASNIEKCPKNCFCNALSKIVYCSRRGLGVVPDALPEGTLQMNLNGNTFRSRAILRANFSHHVTLEHLYLSDCGIEAIEVDTFVDLVNLKWLDMSDNRLKIIQEHTFRGLRLQHLFLNGNEGIRLLATSFGGLITTGLYLHDCGLPGLAPEVLVPLNGTLGNLWLNGNQLDRVDPQLLTIFASLTHIRLASNPLRCNCEVVWLKEFYDRNGDVFKGAEAPMCSAPQRVRGRHFGELSLFDFRCQPPAFSNIDAFFGNARGHLKCVATGDPTPSLYWIQPSGKAIKYDPPQAEEVNRNEGVLVLEAPDPAAAAAAAWGESGTGSGLSGMYICIANNEAGNATLTINVTWPHAHAHAHAKPNNFLHYHNNHVLPPPPTPPHQSRDARRPPHVHQDNFRSMTSVALWALATPSSAPLSTPSITHPRPETDDSVLLVSDGPAAERQPLFTLTELALSVVGTHFATILLTVACLSIYHWTRRRKTDGLTRAECPPKYPRGNDERGTGWGERRLEQHHQHQQQPLEYERNSYEASPFHNKSSNSIDAASDVHFSTQLRLMKR